jgi:4-hydroxymandelate oxidase
MRSRGIAAQVAPAFTNLLELEDLARSKIPQASFDYIAGGAEDEVSLRRNREAFGRWSLRPRVLAEVSKRDLSTTALGTEVSFPVLVAPTAFHGLVHPEAELATARGAAAAGTIMVVSTIATRTLEDVASAAPEAPRWFQLYVYRDRRVTEDLVDCAVNAGYRALVLTVDTPVLGRREKDERNRFALPAGMGIANLRPHGLDGLAPQDQGSALAKYAAELLSPALTWAEVEWLKSVSPVPVAVKGIMTAEDGRLAIEHGADAVVVSNHAGASLTGRSARSMRFRRWSTPWRDRPRSTSTAASGEERRS